MSIHIILNSIWRNPGNRGQRLARTLAAVRWQLFKRLVKRPRPLLLARGAKLVAHADCVVSSALIYSDWPEYRELKFIRRKLGKNDLIIDVGANVGHILLLLADIAGPENLFAFEPTPVTFARLKENWKLNGWPADQLYPVALGATEDRLFIRNTSRPETMNALHQVREDDDIETHVLPLDSFRDLWRNRSIGFLKIDVEGFEVGVLRGSTALLRTERPRPSCLNPWRAGSIRS